MGSVRPDQPAMVDPEEASGEEVGESNEAIESSEEEETDSIEAEQLCDGIILFVETKFGWTPNHAIFRKAMEAVCADIMEMESVADEPPSVRQRREKAHDRVRASLELDCLDEEDLSFFFSNFINKRDDTGSESDASTSSSSSSTSSSDFDYEDWECEQVVQSSNRFSSNLRGMRILRRIRSEMQAQDPSLTSFRSLLNYINTGKFSEKPVVYTQMAYELCKMGGVQDSTFILLVEILRKGFKFHRRGDSLELLDEDGNSRLVMKNGVCSDPPLAFPHPRL